MKTISKAKFITAFSDSISKSGFNLVFGRTNNATAHFYQRLPNGLVLSLALESSSRTAGAFTASYYLSISFTWSFLPEGFPSIAYDRIGSFLTADERKVLSSNPHLGAGVVDVWCAGFSMENVCLLSDAVSKSLPRFLKQKDLLSSLAASEGLKKHAITLRLVLDRVRDSSGKTGHIDDYAGFASEALQKIHAKLPHPNLVSLTALDADRLVKHIGPDWRPPEVMHWQNPTRSGR